MLKGLAPMTKQSENKKSKGFTILFGSAGGILLGWALNKYGKDQIKQFYFQMTDKVKEMQNKWYTDGEKRAQTLEKIKSEVESEQ